MKKIPLEPGRAALSKMGRDAGRRFVVLRAEADYAYVADGDLRKAEKPKKKKRMHLRAEPVFFPNIAAILNDGKLPTNAELRRCIADQTTAPDQGHKGGLPVGQD